MENRILLELELGIPVRNESWCQRAGIFWKVPDGFCRQFFVARGMSGEIRRRKELRQAGRCA
jgi:hypothetical protein